MVLCMLGNNLRSVWLRPLRVTVLTTLGRFLPSRKFSKVDKGA